MFENHELTDNPEYAYFYIRALVVRSLRSLGLVHVHVFL